MAVTESRKIVLRQFSKRRSLAYFENNWLEQPPLASVKNIDFSRVWHKVIVMENTPRRNLAIIVNSPVKVYAVL